MRKLLPVAILLASTALASAQVQVDVPATPATLTTGQQIFLAVQPYLQLALETIIPILLGWAALRFQQWTGHKIEEKNLRVLETTLTNAATLALRGGSKQEALDYVYRGARDAIKAFNLTPDVLMEKIGIKMHQQSAGPVPSAGAAMGLPSMTGLV